MKWILTTLRTSVPCLHPERHLKNSQLRERLVCWSWPGGFKNWRDLKCHDQLSLLFSWCKVDDLDDGFASNHLQPTMSNHHAPKYCGKFASSVECSKSQVCYNCASQPSPSSRTRKEWTEPQKIEGLPQSSPANEVLVSARRPLAQPYFAWPVPPKH